MCDCGGRCLGSGGRRAPCLLPVRSQSSPTPAVSLQRERERQPPSEPRWQIPRGRPRTPARCVPFLTEGRGEPGCRIPSHAIPVLISERPPRGLPRATRILPRSAYVIFTYPTPARVTYRSQRGSHCTCSPGDISLQVLETHTGKD